MCNVTASLAKHPRYDSRRPKQSSGLVLSPVTLLLGDKHIGMELVTQVFITWLGLKLLAVALVLIAMWSRVCEILLLMTTWICGVAHCTRVGWYKVQDPINHAVNWKSPNAKSCYVNAHQGGMKGGSQTVSCSPQMETFKLQMCT